LAFSECFVLLLIKEYNIDVEYWSNMGKSEKDKDGIFHIEKEAIMYKAKNVVIGVGTMGKPNKPLYKIPREIKKQTNFDTKSCIKGEDILVVGGGNSGLEYAFDLRLEHNVTLVHRGNTFDRANEQNINDVTKAQNEGNMKILMKHNIEEVLPTDDGKIKAIFTDNSFIIIDRIVYAIGGTSPVDFLKACDIQINENNKPIVDKNCQSNIKNLFVGGDLIVDKIGSIAVALNHGYIISKYIKENMK
jgi:thioredoxin reductase (NADPH)